VSDQIKTFYFSRARSALKYGLLSLGFKEGDQLLVPDFICDSIFHTPVDNSYTFKFFEVSDDLKPTWDQMDFLITPKVKAILMVHYFGQPQEIDKFLEFSRKHNILLIEDNAHGHGGLYQGKRLGTFGHMGISSPRKFINIHGGGELILKTDCYRTPIPDLPSSEPIKNINFISLFLDRFPNFKNNLRKTLKRRPLYENPLEFQENTIKDTCLDQGTIELIKSTDWHAVGHSRRERFLELRKIAVQNGLQPLYDTPASQSNPWCFAAYASNQNEASSWFDWGWKNNISVFSWPTLRQEQIEDANNKAYNRWKRLICFSTLP
jgi:hypothetical protein